MTRKLAVLTVAALLTGCGPPAAAPPALTPTRNIAPSEQTLVADVDPSIDGQSIYVTNNSSVAITVTGIRQSECVNIGSPCTLIPLRIGVAAGSRIRIFVVRPADSERPYSYRYTWTWASAAR
jgi:hypothetical protein